VAAGASWGGYAIKSVSLSLSMYSSLPLIRVTVYSWIQGNPEFGFGFKALVCHDGVFDAAYNGFSTDELFFVRWDGSLSLSHLL